MATRKTPAKKTPAKKTPAKGGNRWAGVQLPEGFTPITNGEYGEPWDYEAMPVLTGTISGEVREVETGTGKNKRVSKVVTVETDDGQRFDVWESAALASWFEKIEEGSRVSIVFQGYRDTGKASPMKVFVGAIADDEAETPARKTARKSARRR